MQHGNDLKIRLICFDLGGVLVRICRTWEEGCNRAGVELRAPESRGETAQKRNEVVVEYQTGRINCNTFAERISKILKGIYTSEEITTVHRAWMIDEYEGVAEVIDRIHDAELQTACLSNTNHTHWEMLVDYPAFLKLQTKLASHEMGLHKPDPAIFAEAERELNCKGSSILFFDDLEENVKGAINAGWNAIKIDHAGRTDAQILRALELHNINLNAVPH